jgi:hypothetical protein
LTGKPVMKHYLQLKNEDGTPNGKYLVISDNVYQKILEAVT